MIGNIEDREETSEEGVSESDYICVVIAFFEIGVDLLDEVVTVGVRAVHRGGQEVLHRDGIVIVSQLDNEVVRSVDVFAINVTPVAEFVVLPSVAVELV